MISDGGLIMAAFVLGVFLRISAGRLADAITAAVELQRKGK